MKQKLFSIFLICFSLNLFSQVKPHFRPKETHFDIGAGAGFDYGGFGIKMNAYPNSYISLFGSTGHNTLQGTFNVGVTTRIPKYDAVPFITAMYGYNGIVKVAKEECFDETFFGYTVGAGMEFHLYEINSYLIFSILYPFHNEAYNEKIKRFSQDENFELKRVPLDISFSVGFHHMLR